MARLADGEMTSSDLEQYLQGYSDFAFEVRVLKLLVDRGFTCRHSGTYEDPVSQKTRQFDIQAEIQSAVDGRHPSFIRLAIECKNLRPNYPLVIHRVPRLASEAFVDLVWSTEPDKHIGGPLIFRYAERVTLSGNQSPYRAGDYVGKACDQVGKKVDGEIQAADHEVFDRISQSTHSAYELLRSAHYAGSRAKSPVVSLVMPVLVVPDRRLWVVDYSAAGDVLSGPTQVSRVSYFIERDWSIGGTPPEAKTWYSLSHIEICEASTLLDFTNELISDERYSSKTILEIRSEEFRRARAREGQTG